MVSRSTVASDPSTTNARPWNDSEARSVLPAGAPRSVSPLFTTYSDEISVTPARNVITRASDPATINVRLAIMDFPKAAVIGVIGESSAVPHDYTLDGVDLVSRLRMQAEIEAKRRAGGTVVIRSTDPSLLRTVADEVWWFEGGDLRMKGDPREVLAAYHREALRDAGKFADIPVALRRGDGRARVLSIETLNTADQPVSVWQSGEPARIRVTVQFQEEVPDPVIGIMIRTRIGMEVYGTNTELEKLTIGPCAAGDIRVVTFDFHCDLCPQFYTITAASHDPDGVWHDWMEDAVGISVADTRYTAGVANLRARVTCSRG
jgi:hypothetical protein